jgi:hypothetical protein
MMMHDLLVLLPLKVIIIDAKISIAVSLPGLLKFFRKCISFPKNGLIEKLMVPFLSQKMV